MALKIASEKDPAADKDYTIDWSAMLQEGETIVSSVWTADPALTLTDELITAGVCSVWIAGGVNGTTYSIVNRITTSRGLTDERTLQLKVKDQ